MHSATCNLANLTPACPRPHNNHDRVHASLEGVTPNCLTDRNVIALDDYRWQSHCGGFYQLPAAA